MGLFDLLNPEGIDEQEERLGVVACTAVPVIAHVDRSANDALLTSLPIAGKSPASRHSSYSGAQSAVRTRGELSLAYRRLLIEAGPQSDVEAAKVLGRPISSITSTRNGWGDRVAPSGAFELTEWQTKRVRWAWRER